MSISRKITNSAIVLYLAVIYFSGVPESNTLNFRLKEQSLKVAFAVGIWPSWSMFAPNPIKFDSKSYVSITYLNGEVKEYDIEIEPTGILAPFRKARWMKYSQDNLRSSEQRPLLNPAMNHFLHKYNQKGNPIVNLQIKRKWSEVFPFSNSTLHSIYKTPRNERFEIIASQNVER